MMKYSEVKLIIRELHKRGWRKLVGLYPYRKIWRQGDLQYSQTVSVDDLFHTAADIGMIFNYYETKAKHEFNKYERGSLWHD